LSAAALLGIAPPTIRSWRAKGYLRPVPGSPPRRSVYLWDDVLDAEREARLNAIRTSGSDRQVQRDREVLWPARSGCASWTWTACGPGGRRCRGRPAATRAWRTRLTSRPRGRRRSAARSARPPAPTRV